MNRTLERLVPYGEDTAKVLARLTLGALFLQSGLGKFHHLERTVEFFADLGIPFASFQAPIIATLEVGGGVGLLLGLAVPVFALLLSGTMFVALLTAKLGEVSGALELLAESESVNLALLVWLSLSGAGRLSLDHWLGTKWLSNRYPRLLVSPLSIAR